jgi:hypothetical protein
MVGDSYALNTNRTSDADADVSPPPNVSPTVEATMHPTIVKEIQAFIRNAQDDPSQCSDTAFFTSVLPCMKVAVGYVPLKHSLSHSLGRQLSSAERKTLQELSKIAASRTRTGLHIRKLLNSSSQQLFRRSSISVTKLASPSRAKQQRLRA